jgi:hypothetical protein
MYGACEVMRNPVVASGRRGDVGVGCMGCGCVLVMGCGCVLVMMVGDSGLA